MPDDEVPERPGNLRPGDPSEVGAGIVTVPPAPHLGPERQSPAPDTPGPGALPPGTQVGTYEVVREMARSSPNLLYLARDRAVGQRWCVLKEMRDAAPPGVIAPARTDQRILALLGDPRVVDVYNIVGHETSPGHGNVRQRYIVMAYVDGVDLETLRSRGDGTLPAHEAIAYVHGILPALSNLHQRGLVHSDIKPSNIMHSTDRVMKLIDLGAVRYIGSGGYTPFGTAGYVAPEDRATARADLYSAGRTLASLILGPGWVDDQPTGPPTDEAPIRRHDCLRRFLQRACAIDEADRFADADEMAEGLYGVLCQVAAASDGRSRPHTRDRWGPPQPTLDHPSWDQLPLPSLPRQPLVPSHLASAPGNDAEAVIAQAEGVEDEKTLSWSDRATLARAQCQRDNFDEADQMARKLIEEARKPAGQRTGTDSLLRAVGLYLRGQIASARSDLDRDASRFDSAVKHLDEAYSIAPGEPACALALAVASEAANEPDWTRAQKLYGQVAVTDPNWVVAIAGKARALSQLAQGEEAAEALAEVPPTHPLRREALKRACLILQTGTAAPGNHGLADMLRPWARGEPPQGAYRQDVADAASEHLPPGPPSTRLTISQAELAVALFTMALAARGRPEAGPEPDGPVAWVKDTSAGLEGALVEALEALAGMTPDAGLRYLLLDAAAHIRPWGFLS